MKKKLMAALFFIGSFSLQAEFKTSTIEGQMHWGAESQWGVFMRVSPTSLPDGWKTEHPTYKYVPLATVDYYKDADELARAKASATGYALKPDFFAQTTAAVGLDTQDSDYVPYSSVTTPPFVHEKEQCGGIGLTNYGISADKCQTYYTIVDPYALVNNLTVDLKVETFGMFPCNKYGSTTQMWLYAAHKPNKIEQVEPCQTGDYQTTKNNEFVKGIGWYRYDRTINENPFMRFAAAIMTQKTIANATVANNQGYLTISDVNSAAQKIFGEANFVAYFNAVFAVYYSNDASLVSDIDLVYDTGTQTYSKAKVAW